LSDKNRENYQHDDDQTGVKPFPFFHDVSKATPLVTLSSGLADASWGAGANSLTPTPAATPDIAAGHLIIV
jgi:hypothetical protein